MALKMIDLDKFERNQIDELRVKLTLVIKRKNLTFNLPLFFNFSVKQH